MRTWLEMNPSTFVLARGELASFRLRGRRCRVSCVAGRVWVTVSNGHEDRLLSPGEETIFTGRGTVVVEALRIATVRIAVDAATREDVPSLFPMPRSPAGLSA